MENTTHHTHHTHHTTHTNTTHTTQTPHKHQTNTTQTPHKHHTTYHTHHTRHTNPTLSPHTRHHTHTHTQITHMFWWLVTRELQRTPFPVENLRVQSTDVLVPNVHSHSRRGWLTHSPKRRTTRALRLLRKHHRSEALCMAPKPSVTRFPSPLLEHSLLVREQQRMREPS